MLKKTFISLLLFAIGLSAQVPSRHVRTIYVDHLNVQTYFDAEPMVRSKLISSLTQYCQDNCTVMENVAASGDGSQDLADAVLTGTVVIQSNDSRRFHVQGSLRLVNKDGAVLWAGTVNSSPFAKSATSSFADNTAKKLTVFLAQHRTE